MARFCCFLLSVSVLLVPVAFSQTSEEIPSLVGYVTRVVSDTDFDVNQVRVIPNPNVEIQVVREIQGTPIGENAPLFWGERVMVYGSFRDKKRTIRAHKIVEIKPITKEVSGFGLIDRVLSTKGDPAGGGGRMICADGYSILVDKQTATTLEPPLSALSDAGTNIWVRYTGTFRSDGVVVAEKAIFIKNEINAKEEKLLAGDKYDPEKANSNSKQPIKNKTTSLDMKKIPPYHDDVMQARVNRIGQSLIPAYQRALPASDPTKLNFRFYLIKTNPVNDAIALPNGIVLVPKQIAERLTDDSQLATVLASNIASALEKQAYRGIPIREKAAAAEWVGGGAALFLSTAPGVAVWVVAHHISSSTLLNLEEQSDRVSLSLLADAGYNIHEAPVAWWTLTSKHPDKLWLTEPPARSGYLFQVIATSWKTTSATSVAVVPDKTLESAQSD